MELLLSHLKTIKDKGSNSSMGIIEGQDACFSPILLKWE